MVILLNSTLYKTWAHMSYMKTIMYYFIWI